MRFKNDYFINTSIPSTYVTSQRKTKANPLRDCIKINKKREIHIRQNGHRVSDKNLLLSVHAITLIRHILIYPSLVNQSEESIPVFVCVQQAVLSRKRSRAVKESLTGAGATNVFAALPAAHASNHRELMIRDYRTFFLRYVIFTVPSPASVKIAHSISSLLNKIYMYASLIITNC